MKAKEDRASVQDSIIFWGGIFFLVGPWLSMIIPVWVSDITKWVSSNAIVISTLSLAILIFRAAYHSFISFDKLDQRTKPRLTLSCSPDMPGCIIDNIGGHGGPNKALRIVVKSDSDVDVEDCVCLLTGISKGVTPLWGGDNAILTFQPSQAPDSERKCITPRSTHFVDVLFIEFNDSNKDIIKPGTKNHQWNFQPKLASIFSEFGEYMLDIRIDAKGMRSEDRVAKFTYRDKASKLEFVRQPSLSAQRKGDSQT